MTRALLCLARMAAEAALLGLGTCAAFVVLAAAVVAAVRPDVLR